MSTPEILLQKRQSQRESWVDLVPASSEHAAKRVRIRRPLETDLSAIVRLAPLDAAMRCIVGWDGITEADILQSGGSDSVPFHADLARDLLGDRIDWLTAIDAAIAAALEANHQRRKEALGNSAPIST